MERGALGLFQLPIGGMRLMYVFQQSKVGTPLDVFRYICVVWTSFLESVSIYTNDSFMIPYGSVASMIRSLYDQYNSAGRNKTQVVLMLNSG